MPIRPMSQTSCRCRVKLGQCRPDSPRKATPPRPTMSCAPESRPRWATCLIGSSAPIRSRVSRRLISQIASLVISLPATPRNSSRHAAGPRRSGRTRLHGLTQQPRRRRVRRRQRQERWAIAPPKPSANAQKPARRSSSRSSVISISGSLTASPNWRRLRKPRPRARPRRPRRLRGNRKGWPRKLPGTPRTP